MRERFHLKAAVYVFFQKDNKLLFLRRCHTGWMDGWYSLVSGHIDQGETVTQCALREIKEEAGVTVLKKDLKFIHVLHRFPDADYIDFFFLVKKWKGEVQNMEQDKCDDMQWFREDHFPAKVIPHVQSVWKSYKKGISFTG